MSDITIITPPDKIFNQNINLLLLYPNEAIKNDLQDILSNSKDPVNVYIYDINEEHQVDWLLSVHKFCNYVIADLDNFPAEIKQIESYLISQSNTYWLTKGENMYYNKISANRVYDINFLQTKIGGTVEKE